jgi:CDP-diacylglycerol--serine O-phosphatidyltransferase
VLPIFLGIALAAGLLATSPWVTLPCIMLGYLVTLPLSWRAYGKLEAADRAARVAAAAPSPPPTETSRPSGPGIVELRPITGSDGDRSRGQRTDDGKQKAE